MQTRAEAFHGSVEFAVVETKDGLKRRRPAEEPRLEVPFAGAHPAGVERQSQPLVGLPEFTLVRPVLEIAKRLGLTLHFERLAIEFDKDAHLGAQHIGRDGRHSGPELAAALARGLRASGADVIDIGQVTTPMLYFAAHHLATLSGVAVTGSHNPPEYNGLKIMVDGETLAGAAIQGLRARIERGELARGAGSHRTQDIREDYLRRITSDVRLTRPMRLVVDCGNGVAGATAPELYRRLGCKVTELFCEVDGSFPNHHPDPSHPENLADVQRALAQGKGELGFAFDGDGDRLGVVTKNGRIIYPDRQLMLFAEEARKWVARGGEG